MAKKSFYMNKFNSCLGNSRQTLKLRNELKGKFSNSTNIPLLRSSFNNKTEPTDEDNENLSKKFFATIGYKISKHLKKPLLRIFYLKKPLCFLPDKWNRSNRNCGAAGQQTFVRR